MNFNHIFSNLKKTVIPVIAVCIATHISVTLADSPLDLDLDSLEEDKVSLAPHSEAPPHTDGHAQAIESESNEQPIHHDPIDQIEKTDQDFDPNWNTKDLEIRTVGPITPFREKSLDNENIAAPLNGIERNIEMASFWETLSNAQSYRDQEEYQNAIQICITLLEQPTPEEINRLALIELAYNLEETNELQKAFQVLSQYVVNYPKADNLPEVYLSQGKILRNLGASKMAIGKFYTAMSSTLSVENSTEERYKRINLIAQTEIADTYYNSGDFPNAIQTYKLILKGDTSLLDLPLVEFKLVRSKIPNAQPIDELNAISNYLERYPSSKFAPEAQFIKITQLLELNNDKQFMASVLELLRSSPESFSISESELIPWQKRSGNLLANYLFDKKDFSGARAVFKQLQKMDKSPDWLIPVTYQLAQCNERLDLPAEATDAYMEILAISNGLSDDEITFQIKTIRELSDFRLDQIAWLSDAREKGRSLLDPSSQPGKSQAVDEDKNSKWLAKTFSRVNIDSAARIFSKLEATETSGVLKHLPPSEQAAILRKIGSLGEKEKSLASAIAVTLGLPKELAGLED